MITEKNILKHELIGLDIEVVQSANITNIGLKGKVTAESRNTLTIETEKGEKTLVKSQCIFLLTLPSGEKVKVAGKNLVSRPEDRMKKKQPRW